MKIQIRRGVFETNSSNEHSLTIMSNDDYKAWKEGKKLARVKCEQDAEVTWGNFWSSMYILEFIDNTEDVVKMNERELELLKKRKIERLNHWKNKCLNYKKKIETPLTDDEIKELTWEEQSKYEEDLYDDKIYEFDEKEYNEELERYNNLTIKDIGKYEDSLMTGFWMTFEDFWRSWIDEDDCYSPFEHTDNIHNIHIIGKYYHS